MELTLTDASARVVGGRIINPRNVGYLVNHIC